MTDRVPLPQRWPEPPFRLVLVEPEIPGNAGAVARLCAATGSELHLVEPLGFQLTDAHLRRAGLDYWKHVRLVRHPGLDSFLDQLPPDHRCFFFSTRASQAYSAVRYEPGDYLVFGSETRGLPDRLIEADPSRAVGVPIRLDQVRCLNLAATAAIALYEGLRQVAAR